MHAESLNYNAGLITNFEVNKTLEAQKALNKTEKRATKDMRFVEKQVGHYLHHHSLVKRQTEASIQAFLEGSAQFKLTLAEQLQIVNLCPTTLVEVYLSVDDIESRIGQEGAVELLYLINSTLYVEVEETEQIVEHAPLLKERTPAKKRGGRGIGRDKDGHRGKSGRGGRGKPSRGSTAPKS
jgi:hypothetical protein